MIELMSEINGAEQGSPPSKERGLCNRRSKGSIGNRMGRDEMRFVAANPASRRKKRGAVMVEFALGYSLLLVILAGLVDFGYGFYIYNSLQGAVRDAARYASLRPYDWSATNPGSQWEVAVKNMAVSGDPADGSGTSSIPSLTLNNITVESTNNGTVPDEVSVQIDGLAMTTFFREWTLNGKPRATFPYMGRVVVP